MVGFFVGRVYQHQQPNIFDHYPMDWSGYYGLDENCEIDFESNLLGTFLLIDGYQIDGAYCRIIGSSERDGWYSLKTDIECSRQIPAENTSTNEVTSEYVPPQPILIKAASDDQIRVQYGDRPETLYHCCGWKPNK